MDNYQLNGALLANFFIGGSANLTNNKEQVNALNVFPVPDGDTGTNMGLTMTSSIRDIMGKSSASEVANKVASGALMGARGNSGVILSQIFRGFAQGLGKKEIINAHDFAHAMQKGVDLAYKSVMRPVEGTILTVSKEMAKGGFRALEADPDLDVIELIKVLIIDGKVALDNTPNQLPALKQAGVVDAGGMGLICIFEGGLKALLGEEFKIEDIALAQAPAKTITGVDDKSDLKYCYCTEFFIHGANINVEPIRKQLAKMGDSQVIVGDENMVKTHIHTDNPGKVLAYAIGFGSLHDIKIDNMKDQHRETLGLDDAAAAPTPLSPEELSGCGVVAVASGHGIEQIFTEMGVSQLISGGQSMNPSAEEIVNAINATTAAEVVILPNNSNIILAAEQAKKLTDRKVHVVPTKFLTQGISAMMVFDPEASGEENQEAMLATISEVKSAQITYAVRDSVFDDQEIHENDILGLLEGKIVAVDTTIERTVLELLTKMVDEDVTLLTILYGEDISEEQAMALAAIVSEAYPDLEIEVQIGGQSVYYYLIAAE